MTSPHDGSLHTLAVTAVLDDAIAAVAVAERIIDVFHLAGSLRLAAALEPDAAAAAHRVAELVRNGDDMLVLAGLHALGAIADPVADEILLSVIRAADEPFAGHAAWVMGARRSSPEAHAALAELVAAGGFSGMLAERTILEWAAASQPVRVVWDRLPRPTRTGGLVVIQPFLHAHLDASGSSLGVGDAGGIASLLLSLGNALAEVDGVDEVITVTGRRGDEPSSEVLRGSHRVERITVGGSSGLPWREAWVHRSTIERDLLELGRRFAQRNVVWHLRMADVGTLAAAAAARRLGQPVVFTAAPDPHIVIDALQDSGVLDRSRFGIEDASAQYWFRARMVERLAASADRLVLLPRPTIREELVELVGVDPAVLAERAVVVAEGIDVGNADRAAARAADGTAPPVSRVLESIPIDRRHLPWLLTIGRLHTTKGAHRIVEAVAAEATLASVCNIVIVGGDVAHPSADERSAIERVERAGVDLATGSVTLTGHLPPSDVADLLAWTGSHDGVYVCASDKEEFGLAIVEALAAGAVVVAPQRGGPRSYVADGDTGVLCDTLDPHALRLAIVRALALTGDPARRERAQTMVRSELSVEEMARRLAEVYPRRHGEHGAGVKLLVVSPDYASHALPMIEVGRRWKATEGSAVVATGRATRPLVEAAGLEWIELRLGKGSNSGVIEVKEQPSGEDDMLQAFFDATRLGPVPTLLHQARLRLHDLLHEPDAVFDRLGEILIEVRPDRIVVDHVAFGARLALHALDAPAATMVLGHPTALSAPGEWYGMPPAWPHALRPSQADLASLEARCRASVEQLADASAEFLSRRAPGRPPLGDLTSSPGAPTIYVHPASLHNPARSLPAHHVFIGSLARHESLGDVELPDGDGPLVTVALGSFLSARGDVLATAVEAARQGGWRLALAHGSTPIEQLGALPTGALVARHIPQVALLEHSDVMVHHGGNGSVCESAAAGVPMVVLPFSTDQFAAAESIERTRTGLALAPNSLTVDELAAGVDELLAPDARAQAADLAASVAAHGGASAAVEAIRVA